MRWIVARSPLQVARRLGGRRPLLRLPPGARRSARRVSGVRAPIVEVQTIALGNTSTEVEELITIPIEDALNGIEGLDKMRSYSVEQLVDQALFQARNRPYRSRSSCRSAWQASRRSCRRGPAAVHDAAPLLDGPGHEDRADLERPLHEEMSAIAYWKIRQRLLRVPGVANVLIYGERLQQRHVQVDPEPSRSTVSR